MCANAGIPEQSNFLLEDRLDENGELAEPSFKLIDVNVNGVMRSMSCWTVGFRDGPMRVGADGVKSGEVGLSLFRKEQDAGGDVGCYGLRC